MPKTGVFGAHHILQQSNAGRTHRLSELIAESNESELTIRREIDALTLAGQVKRFYVGEQVMVKKTDGFNPDNPVDVDRAGLRLATTGLPPEQYTKPAPTRLVPAEEYEQP